MYRTTGLFRHSSKMLRLINKNQACRGRFCWTVASTPELAEAVHHSYDRYGQAKHDGQNSVKVISQSHFHQVRLPPYCCSPAIITRQFSTSQMCMDSEVDRITKAYVSNDNWRSPQKHDGNRLIYEVRGQTMLRVVSVSFYATAVAGLYLAPDFISSAVENEVLNRETIINLVAVAFAVVGLPSLLRMVSKRVVLKLYHNEARESYLAVTQSLVLTNKLTKFSLGDVEVRQKNNVFHRMFNLTTFTALRQPMHVNSYNFKLPSDYNHLLGYDKTLGD